MTNRRPVLAFMALAVVLLGVLVYAVAWGINGWAQGLVLGRDRADDDRPDDRRQPEPARLAGAPVLQPLG